MHSDLVPHTVEQLDFHSTTMPSSSSGSQGRAAGV